MEREKLEQCLEILEREYGGQNCALNFVNPFQLLIATILSAQCTDKRVNLVTAELFPRFPDAAALAALEPGALEPYIRTCGLYKTKAKNIVLACRALQQQYAGQVPADFDTLIKLPGVGRKTANVVLSNAFGQDAIAVDTHVFRVSNRLGLAHASNVEATEDQLRAAIPKEKWSQAHHWLIWHGRMVCAARHPACAACPLAMCCEYPDKQA
ncbi:MAG: endonuclease III [Eubacteriales bacterium]|nr:endonuclease III [Eubacteriales bacterium]